MTVDNENVRSIQFELITDLYPFTLHLLNHTWYFPTSWPLVTGNCLPLTSAYKVTLWRRENRSVSKRSLLCIMLSVLQGCRRTVITYLCSVGTSQTQLHDKDSLRGDNSIGRGVGRRSDHWVGAALSWQHTQTVHVFNQKNNNVDRMKYVCQWFSSECKGMNGYLLQVALA